MGWRETIVTDGFNVEITEGHDRREHAHLALRRFGHEHDEPEVPRVLVDDVLLSDIVKHSPLVTLPTEK